MPEVTDIGEWRITRERHRALEGCRHRHITIADQGQVVTCDDCHVQITAAWALTNLCDDFNTAMRKLAGELRRAKEVADRQIHLKAAQRVEDAWRSRAMVPTCPHCRAPIFASDGFGNARMNRAFAVKRRQSTTVQTTPPNDLD